MTTEDMLGRLEIEIEMDARKMFRWRQIHRAVACAVTLTLIALPVLAAMDALGDSEHYCLFALTVIAAYEGLFRPAVHSARRRGDAVDMTDLLWELRSALIATPATDAAQRLAVHDKFRQRYQALFRARGKNLVDFSLAQHENETANSVDTRSPGRASRETEEATGTGTTPPSSARPIAPIAPPDAANANGRRPIEPASSPEGTAQRG